MLSFAKYLELRFYAGSYKRRASVEPCGHSLHKDHYQYFAYANMVASFKLVVAFNMYPYCSLFCVQINITLFQELGYNHLV